MKTILLFLPIFILVGGCSSQYEPPSQASLPISTGPTVSGVITIAPKLAGKVSPNDVIYLMARQGMGPPLAVKKMMAGNFPIHFEIGSADVMMHGMPLQGEMTVVARVDKDGMAGPPQPGDLEGKSLKPVLAGDQSVEVKIDKLFSK